MTDSAFLLLSLNIPIVLHSSGNAYKSTHSECKKFLYSLFVEFWETKRWTRDVRCVPKA
jgi:hypothetical protein